MAILAVGIFRHIQNDIPGIHYGHDYFHTLYHKTTHRHIPDIIGKTKIRLEDLPLVKRLRVTLYNIDDCNAAIRGQKIPEALGLKVQRFAVIRGIRHHDGFAHELRGVAPEFTRALNACAIMSGVIPEINDS